VTPDAAATHASNSTAALAGPRMAHVISGIPRRTKCEAAALCAPPVPSELPSRNHDGDRHRCPAAIIQKRDYHRGGCRSAGRRPLRPASPAIRQRGSRIRPHGGGPLGSILRPAAGIRKPLPPPPDWPGSGRLRGAAAGRQVRTSYHIIKTCINKLGFSGELLSLR